MCSNPPLGDCQYCHKPFLTFWKHLPKECFVSKNKQGLTKFDFSTPCGIRISCHQGVFNMKTKSLICESCDQNDNKIIVRQLQASCYTLSDLLVKYR